VWSDTFSIGSHTVTGSYAFQTFATGTAPNEIDCSLSFTVADPNHPATGSVSGSCNAAGQLYVSVSVSDPDGGTPGYSIHIDNIADLPVSWGGSTTLGPYSPPRDGVTYGIFIYVADPQTGGIYGPFSGTYNCPVASNPTPTNPPTCNLTVNPSTVDPGGSATLFWSTTDANYFQINQGIGPQAQVSGGRKPKSSTPPSALPKKKASPCFCPR
jgi:hypothetical protein